MTHFRLKDTHRQKVKGWKKIFHANRKKKVGVAVFVLDKIDFKSKAIVRDKEGHYIMMKGTIPVSYTHLTLPTTGSLCRSRWSPYH